MKSDDDDEKIKLKSISFATCYIHFPLSIPSFCRFCVIWTAQLKKWREFFILDWVFLWFYLHFLHMAPMMMMMLMTLIKEGMNVETKDLCMKMKIFQNTLLPIKLNVSLCSSLCFASILISLALSFCVYCEYIKFMLFFHIFFSFSQFLLRIRQKFWIANWINAYFIGWSLITQKFTR